MQQMPNLKVISFHTEMLSQTICLSFIVPACVHIEMTGKDLKKIYFVDCKCILSALSLFVCPKPLYASSTIIS